MRPRPSTPVIACLLALLLAVTAAGCGSNEDSAQQPTKPASTFAGVDQATVAKAKKLGIGPDAAPPEELEQLLAKKKRRISAEKAYSVEPRESKIGLIRMFGPPWKVTHSGEKVEVECWLYRLDDGEMYQYCFDSNVVAVHAPL